jgi:hypothetical protein
MQPHVGSRTEVYRFDMGIFSFFDGQAEKSHNKRLQQLQQSLENAYPLMIDGRYK